ncbi:GntR family transcriptional regulator [Acidisphaera sp. L21]|uniref:GntR family transcriptional regulator n=1 Tax=Acidisphaera sp. L21 TaxID=1641851 RepID=UPI00131C683E|nr:GntR family transcriptional regulator [Acidisphaera sp. L21]
MSISQAADRFTPIYMRIQDQVRSRILSGELAVGDRVPSDTELADAFHTTRATVRHALTRLVYEGLIVRHVGRGSYVAPRPQVASPIDTESVRSFEEQVGLSDRQVTYRMLADEIVPADEPIAQWLQRPPGTKLRRIARLRLIDLDSICLDIRFLPEPFAQAVTSDMLGRHSMHAIMSSLVGERIPVILVNVTAETADTETAAQLGVKHGAALLIREHVYFDREGEPILYGRPLYRGDIGLSYRMKQV